MKTLLATILALGASLAQANTIYPLQTPTDLPQGNQPAGRYCVGTSFSTGDTVSGTCQSLVVGSCGRCAPPYTATVYAATWDPEGNLKSDSFCGTARITRSYPPVWTYQPGYTSGTCYLPPSGFEQILVYDPSVGGEHWFGYVTSSPDGAYELLTERYGVVNQF